MKKFFFCPRLEFCKEIAMAISTVRLESNDEEKDSYDGKEANRINWINRINRKKREHDAKRAVQKAIEARASFLISIMELLSPLTTKLLHMLHKTNYSWTETSLLGSALLWKLRRRTAMSFYLTSACYGGSTGDFLPPENITCCPTLPENRAPDKVSI